MYIPKHFREDDPATLYDLMRQHNFAALVTHHDGQLMASHLPFMVDAERGLLLAHLARANPQWQHFAEGREVLVIFQGPHAYITPSWYAAAPSIPTWAEQAGHAARRLGWAKGLPGDAHRWAQTGVNGRLVGRLS
jgi:transcriptional regulator